MQDVKQTKAQETRQRILDNALKLFLEEGYENATMRKIAQLSGLSPGATYYYFKTKHHIIFHFYEQSYEDQLLAVKALLQSEQSLKARIAGAVQAHIDIARPFHSISRELFKIASDPSHPLSPFSEPSQALRDRNIVLFEEVVAGADVKVAADLRERLPELLWLYKIAIILFWINDSSPEQEKTDRLIEKSADLIVRLIKAHKYRVMRPFTTQVINIIDEFKPYQYHLNEKK